MFKVAGLAIPVTLLMLSALPLQAVAGQKIQCWADEHGVRVCGDRVPPEYVKKERKVFDEQGRVVDIRDRQKTAEEAAAAEAAEAEATAAQRRAQERQAYDIFLTDTYSSVKDLERARNERLATLDGRVGLARQAVASDEKSKVAIQQRIDGMLKSGRPTTVPAKQLRDTEKTLRDNRLAIEQMAKDREKVCTEFQRDIVRFQELTMGSSAYAGQCPAPGSLSISAPLTKPAAGSVPPKKTP
ncbi:hypothetical protein D0B54_21175 [Solimonas sp. K1W22B-7]|uniref:hypothetical protein n=1 Tax=Solimonas sp. K1W22B-7 TaxID=2303331 RepID=UPI000E335D3F|nr:hypothetical protein [Solimonas sp. K1W22B-7]AXQ31038.1 hypothetical protein D0B54_21175 [Solimonas sp. K1W22B-7]